MNKLNHQDFLASSPYINWQDPLILSQARLLAQDTTNKREIAQSCFEFVRDKIRHSWDYQENPVTCKASDVLRYGTGYCYAKSHLLAALLRANDIPTALCYQRLALDDEGREFCLHGLNALYLEEYGWYRVDARGNKPGVCAEFMPPQEQLAFPATAPGEAMLPNFYAEPLPIIIKTLEYYQSYDAVAQNLPDIQLHV